MLSRSPTAGGSVGVAPIQVQGRATTAEALERHDVVVLKQHRNVSRGHSARTTQVATVRPTSTALRGPDSHLESLSDLFLLLVLGCEVDPHAIHGLRCATQVVDKHLEAMDQCLAIKECHIEFRVHDLTLARGAENPCSVAGLARLL